MIEVLLSGGEVTDNIYVLGIAGSEDDSGTINEDSGGGARRRRDTEDVLDLDPEYEGEVGTHG